MKQFGKLKIDAKTVWGVVGAVAWIAGIIAGRKNDGYAREDLIDEASKKATEAVLEKLSSSNN